MIQTILDNLLPWFVQVFVIAGLGSLLPLIFRLQHPRSHLVYCHILLLASMVVPIVQPWQHPAVLQPPLAAATAASAAVPAQSASPIKAARTSAEVFIWILASGVGVRLLWLAAGLCRLRGYRITARPLYPVLDSIVAARAVTGASALCCLSTKVTGPVTFGFFRPIILLPDSFLSLGQEAQCAIACHEFLHVRRQDWLIALFEELASVLFWFHPAVWWLLSQTRLLREQVVDARVVLLTENPESYINALLAMAGARPGFDLAPAPLFLRRRHLAQRMHFLLSEVSMSRVRLLYSYASITCLLLLSGAAAFVWFPLVGQAQVIPGVTYTDSPGVIVNPGGNAIVHIPIGYPVGSLRDQKEGAVFVELTVNKVGAVTDARVISGPEEFRRFVLQSVLQWKYAPGSPSPVVVSVDFRVPATAIVSAAPVGAPASSDPAEVRGVLGTIDVTSLPEPLAGQVARTLQRFQGQPFSNGLMAEVNDGVRKVDERIVLRWSLNSTRENQVLRLAMRSSLSPQAAPAIESAAVGNATPATPPGRVRVVGAVQQSQLIQQVNPIYPEAAKQGRVSGIVELEAVISRDGRVDNLRVINGHPLLTKAAIDAVKLWVYAPTLLNGQPVEVVTNITVNFSFSN